MKVISVTPAGRSNYINILARYLLRHRKSILEHHFWVNTDSPHDIQTIQSWCDTYPTFFRTVEPSFPPPRTVRTIHHFYRDYTDPETIYLRFDDDICWIAEDCIDKMIAFRLAHPEFFLVYANTVNHTTCNRIHQRQGVGPANIDGYFSGRDGALVHKSFLMSLLKGEIDKYKFDHYVATDYERVSTNCISWFGSELAKINGKVVGNEEQFLAVNYPLGNGLFNCICGEAMTCHFAYGPQRHFLETETNYLQLYDLLSKGHRLPKLYL